MAASNYLKRKHRRHKKKARPRFKEIELNVMPFVDVFSLLTTFLLMAAVFVAIGIIEVQIPFLTSEKPDSTPQRVLDLKVDMEKDKVTVVTSYTLPPTNEVKKEYKLNPADLEEMHLYLVGVKRKNLEVDRVSFFTDIDVKWGDMAKVLDVIKLRKYNDPIFVPKGKENDALAVAEATAYLYPKVVFSSVMLN